MDLSRRAQQSDCWPVTPYCQQTLLVAALLIVLWMLREWTVRARPRQGIVCGLPLFSAFRAHVSWPWAWHASGGRESDSSGSRLSAGMVVHIGNS
eukprot:4377897-Prymnesium_polylepis.3